MFKKLLFSAAISLLSFAGYSQEHPGKHPEILLNHQLKVLPLKESLQQYGYHNFYVAESMAYNEVYKGPRTTKYEELVGKTFKVTAVKPYDKYGKQMYKLVLTSPEISQTLYYDYDPGFDHDYHFEAIDGLVIPSDVYCDDIIVESDKFTGEITAKSPIFNGITFYKITSDGVTNFYISMNQVGATLNVGKKGLIILLADGKKIVKPDAKIDVDVNRGASGYVYSVFERLTKEDIKKLSESPMTDKRLFIYDGTIERGGKLMEYIKCLAK